MSFDDFCRQMSLVRDGGELASINMGATLGVDDYDYYRLHLRYVDGHGTCC